MELRETIIDQLRKRLGRDPTEEEIKVERDRKWRFALADMGITAECFLDEKQKAARLLARRGSYCWPTCPMVGSPRPTP